MGIPQSVSALWHTVNVCHSCGLLKQTLLWWGSRATLVCRNNCRYLECSWKFYSFRKLAAVCFLLGSIISSVTVSWLNLYFQAQNLSYKRAWSPIMWLAVDYSLDISATIAPVRVTCLAGHCWGSLSLHLGRTFICLFLLVAWQAPSYIQLLVITKSIIWFYICFISFST